MGAMLGPTVIDPSVTAGVTSDIRQTAPFARLISGRRRNNRYDIAVLRVSLSECGEETLIELAPLLSQAYFLQRVQRVPMSRLVDPAPTTKANVCLGRSGSAGQGNGHKWLVSPWVSVSFCTAIRNPRS